MRQINNNKYLREFVFSSAEEASTFFNNQTTEKKLSLEDTFGDNYYCYVCYDSLTKEVEFILSFSSDTSEDNLFFLFWENRLILDTGTTIYLIDKNLNIKSSLEITTPLVGLHSINKDRLLILEEAYLRIIDSNGNIIKAELFDLLEDFSIKNNVLSIQTCEESRIIELI
ncbi:hypothetical protein [Wandonia haliotis]